MGFTLMEMLVVLTVIGLLAAIMASSMSRRPAYLGRERLVADLAGRMAKASNEARAGGRPVAFELERWLGLSAQGSALDKWIVCRLLRRITDMGRHAGRA